MPGIRPGHHGPLGLGWLLTRSVRDVHASGLQRADCGAVARHPSRALRWIAPAAGVAPGLAHAESGALAWPWAFAALAVAAVCVTAWLAWRLGRAQAALPATGTGRSGMALVEPVGQATAQRPTPVPPQACGSALDTTPAPAPTAVLLARTLDLQASAALLLECPHGSASSAVLRHLNAAAARLLPMARAGQPAAPWLAQLPQLPLAAQTAQTAQTTPASRTGAGATERATDGAALAAAVATLPPGGQTQVAGWLLSRVGALDGSAEAVVLLQQPAPAPITAAGTTPPAADADTETEQFSFTLSHDLRAPIRVVEGFTRIVKEDYGALLDRVGNDHLDRVLGAAARMNLMIDALLTLARLSRQPLSRQGVNLSQLAHWVAEELKRSEPDRQVQFDIEPGLQATGDPTLLRLVLENLLGNAWKYSGRNERSRIRFAQVVQAGASAYLVQDDGAGFDMRGADRLFGLFQRLHSASEFPGSGVGLASVRRIVQRHGGQIWAESEPGRGASFYFTLTAG